MSLEDDTLVTFDHILSRFNTYIENEGVDPAVSVFYSNILRANTVFPVQLRREELTRSRRFYSTVKCWVLEIRDLDISRQLPGFDGSPSLTVRVTVEGQTKTTTKSNPPRHMDGTFEPVKIGQDVEFFAKRPTSCIHLDVIHINEEEPDGSLEREVLIGTVPIPLRTLESQRMIRQWCKVMLDGESVAELKVRLLYNFKEDLMVKWAPEMGLARSPKEGGGEFMVGILGVGSIGGQILDALLRCNQFRPGQIMASSRRPETLAAYEKLGVLCGSDNAAVAQRADLLVLAVQPNTLPQVASAVRGHVRAETLVVSLVAGVTAERTAQMLHVSQVVKPQLGSESGLPVPPPPGKQRRRKSVSLEAGVVPGQVNPGQVNASLRREEERQAALREAELAAHVQTAARALISDAAAYAALVAGLWVPLGTLGLAEADAQRVAAGGACNAMGECRLQYHGEQQPLPEVEDGERVLVMPGAAEVEDRPGVVVRAVRDARREYLVDVGGGKEVRVRRNRLVRVEGEGGAEADPEEGFALAQTWEMPAAEGIEQAAAFFKLVGEQAIGLRSRMPEKGRVEPSVSQLSVPQSVTQVATEKSQAWTHLHVSPERSLASF